MDKVVAYPAVLDDRDNKPGVYTVTFPDVPGAISEGDSIAQAMENGSVALGLLLADETDLSKASDVKKVENDNPECIVTLISSNLTEAKKNVKKPTVKKNTTIPGDLAQKAEEAGINFSQTLAEALRQKLNLSN